ncbi:DUF2264 domain-containing protein [Pseudochryseolinea flava]|uniref:DUF2264 domain-containing protein n=1 Tax=Pseudochryseolinea flava TaxID=2059302 RepID=A0A364XWW3_9BACT|nr:DUF2264 domain-containing protein [Pseudochryseolinea flava]RAV98245.1 hypothetical protein DQQ10_24905 [Pseudochryseolinea flava]
MIRRNFLKGFSLLGAGSTLTPLFGFRTPDSPTAQESDRDYWIAMLTRITQPVLDALHRDRIKELMPVESHVDATFRKEVTYLEALGRSLAGIAPWLELGADTTAEGKMRDKFIQLSVGAIRNAVTPTAKSFLNFTRHGQPLVDAAFLAHALIRAPKQLWGNLDEVTRQHLVTALKSTRAIKPYYSNWLLFSAMVEAALLKFTNDYDPVRVDYALRSHEEWYKGDGMYGDGPEFHADYYNSFVIQPMLLDIWKTIYEVRSEGAEQSARIVKRAQRFAEIQERMISPEGAFPPLGRSLAYRCGAFQLLSQMALQKQLPNSVTPAQVRSALTAVIKTTMDAPGTFDTNGWLRIGLVGHQPEIGEHYISTGSLYLCSVAFLPLGLKADNEFWNAPGIAWTSKKAFAGQKFSIDRAI